ncbi:MAG: hypothetical protein WCA31_06600 [Acidimicrobiales bacterium]
MIATSVTYDWIFVAHIIGAVASIIVFVTMRFAALGVAKGADSKTQLLRFPERRNWAARVIHIMPITGLIMSLSGGKSVALYQPWVIVGLLCYLAAAGHLEARTLPEERVVASKIARDGLAEPEQGRQLVRSIDTVLLLVGLAFLSMLIQF